MKRLRDVAFATLMLVLMTTEGHAGDREDCKASNDKASDACTRLAVQLLNSGAMANATGQSANIFKGLGGKSPDIFFDQAIKDLTEALQLKQEARRVESIYVACPHVHVEASIRQGDADYDQAIRLGAENDAETYYARAEIYFFHKRETDRAIADYDEAIRLKPICRSV